MLLYSALAQRQFTSLWQHGLGIIKAIPRILKDFLQRKIILDIFVQCTINKASGAAGLNF